MQYVAYKIYFYIYSDITFLCRNLWRSYSLSRPQYKSKIRVDNVACVADVILIRLVTSVKQSRDPCSGPPADWTNYRKCMRFDSVLFHLIDKLAMAFFSRLLANHSAILKSWYTGGALNKDFSPVLQRNLTTGFSSAVCGAGYRYGAYYKL